VDPEEGSVDPLDVTWSDSDMRVAGPESQKAVGVSDEEELFRQEDAILMKVFGEVGEDGVRRSGRERRPVDSFIPLDKFSDERDYDWDQGRVNYMDYGENVESDVPGYMAFLAVKKPSISHKYTLTSPDAEQWDKARRKEMSVHDDNTWESVQLESIPRGTAILPLKWVYTVKRDGTYKARIVCCGNFDPFEGPTYAPTAVKSVMWLVMALVILFNMEVRIFDISAAFVSERITREVFVTLGGRYFRLLKFLYGLKDAPRGFNDGMSIHLKEGGYSQSVFDPCLFFKWEGALSFIYIYWSTSMIFMWRLHRWFCWMSLIHILG
jgi:hypothetical protein